MHRTLALVLLLGTSLVAAPALGQPNPDNPLEDEGHEYDQITHIPLGRRCVVDGEIFQCYNLEEFRQLLGFDVDFHYLQLEVLELRDLNLSLTEVIRLQGESIELQAQSIDLLQAERSRLVQKWTDENRLRLEAENRPMIGSWVAWGLVAAEAAVILGMVLVLLVGG
jgi:hypothetical protein